MRIVVDLNRCQGYAQCVPLAPDVLKLVGEEARLRPAEWCTSRT
jgi:ferredoxin